MSTPPKVLLVTSELFPAFGYPTAGGGVRAQQLHDYLKSLGFQIDLALARSSAEGRNLPDWATRFLYRVEYLDGLIEQADPDLVLTEGWEPLTHLRFDDQRLYAADCPGPLLLEARAGDRDDHRTLLFHKLRALARADAVLYSNAPMRFYLGGFLALAGWKPDQFDSLVEAPIALGPNPPARKAPGSGEFQIFVGGVSWAWHDSSAWVLRLADALEERGIGRILLYQGKHPNHPEAPGVFEPLDPRLLSHPRVQASPLVNWDALVETLRATPLAIEWSPTHFEREVASTLRLVTCLWCGVPVIVRPHLAIAKEIQDAKAGWVLEDWESVVDLIDDLSRNPSEVEERSVAARRLALQKHAWPYAHPSLGDLLASLARREKEPSLLQHATDTFREQEEELHRLRIEHKAMVEDLSALRERTRLAETDAESFRALRQKLPYRIWKRILG